MQKNLLRAGAVVGALALLAIGSSVLPMALPPVVFRVVMLCGIAIIMAVSLNIINGFTGQFSIGHAGFQAVGAYSAAALTVYGHDRLFPFVPKDGTFSSPLYSLTSGAPAMIVALLVGGSLSALIGYIVGLPSLRLRGDYLAIVTLGFGEIIRVIVENTDAVGGPRGFSGVSGGVSVPALTNFFWVYAVALLTIVVARNLRFSVYGLRYLSVREDEIAAQAMGINTTRVKVSAFVLGAFFAEWPAFYSRIWSARFSSRRSTSTKASASSPWWFSAASAPSPARWSPPWCSRLSRRFSAPSMPISTGW